MANTKIFASARAEASPRAQGADAVNHAGGRAYALSDKAALAQMAVTGVFNDTYYTTGAQQLDTIKALAARVDTEFLAKLAVYARHKAYMKDLPAYLCAVLAERDVARLALVFDKVIDNGKMLRNFVQVIRSGQAGRQSLGTRPKKLVASWLNNASDAQLLAASVGNNPSLADVIKLCHVKASTPQRDAFFKHLLGRAVEQEALPELVRALEAFRRGDTIDLPKVPFELLTSLPLSQSDWVQIARQATWTQTRMNLNTFQRQGVFESKEMVSFVADKLQDPEQVAKSRVFPYQLLAAFLNVNEGMPVAITNALQAAMEHALANVPLFEQETAVLVDTSGSMKNSVTGTRPGATSKIRYVDVACLFASAVLRRNANAQVVPFDLQVHTARLNARDAVVTNTQKLARFGGGGTNCSAALKHLNEERSEAGLVIFISDNESWADTGRIGSKATATMEQWARYKQRVPAARLVCIDISPNSTTHAKERRDILNVGGFSDEVFNIVGQFSRGELTAEHWLGEVEQVTL